LLKNQPAEWNRLDLIRKRDEYFNRFMGQAIVSHTVFVNQCDYNKWTARSQSRVIQGERAYRQICGQRGRNLTVTLAISLTGGLIFHCVITRGINAQKFANLILIQMKKLYSSTAVHQHTITQAILGPTPSLRSCPLIVHF